MFGRLGRGIASMPPYMFGGYGGFGLGPGGFGSFSGLVLGPGMPGLGFGSPPFF